MRSKRMKRKRKRDNSTYYKEGQNCAETAGDDIGPVRLISMLAAFSSFAPLFLSVIRQATVLLFRESCGKVEENHTNFQRVFGFRKLD